MPRRNFRSKGTEDDKFETDAFSFLNDEESTAGKPHPDSSRIRDEDDADFGDSDDDAPEVVGFHESKQTVLDQIKSALQQVDSEKKKKKDLRKKIDEQYKEQKAKKREQLEKCKLPEDVLESIEDSIPAKIPKLDKKSKNKKNAKSQVADPDADSKDAMQAAATHLAEQASEDFIGFTDRESGVVVAEVKAVERQTKSVAQTAADFRQGRLYGSHVRRESNKERLATMEKRKQRFR